MTPLRRRRRAAVAGLLAAIVMGLLLSAAARAQQAVRPDISPGQVQKRIPVPTEPAQPPPDLSVPAAPVVTPGAPLRFVLTGVVIEGATAFDAASLAPLYEEDLAREIDLGDVEKIVQRITARYRDAGYFLSRAVARPQPLEQGILRVTVIEGYVRRVLFRDAEPGEEALLLPYLSAVLASRPVQLASLERALLLLEDLPGLHVGSSLEAADENSGAYDLVLRLQHQRLAGYASLDNRGTESLGPWEALVSGSVTSVASAFDRLQLSLFNTPNRPRELVSPELLYDTPLGEAGTQLALSVARTQLQPGGSLAPDAFDAMAMRYAARLTYPVLRSRDRSLWLGAGFDVEDSSERSADVPVFDDHLRVLRARANYTQTDDGGSTDLTELEASQGLSALGASRPAASGLSRVNGRADFSKLAASLTRQQVIGERWAAQLALAGQKSAQPLLLSEQFALGGARFGRAYDPAEIAGDDALAGSFELRYGEAIDGRLLRSYQLYGFYDLGAVWNRDVGFGAQRQSLASLGAGIRLALVRNKAASLEIAKPLTRPVAAENGKPVRVFVSLSAPF